MTDRYQVFLSYSRKDGEAAARLRAQLDGFGLSTFKDDASIREGDLWLVRLQEAVDGCGSFVVLVGRDGVRRWIGAETQAALSRYFGPHEERERLPIFPVLLGETTPETLPAFLRLFQATRWNGTDALPQRCPRTRLRGLATGHLVPRGPRTQRLAARRVTLAISGRTCHVSRTLSTGFPVDNA
jgi:hypothetical protein